MNKTSGYVQAKPIPYEGLDLCFYKCGSVAKYRQKNGKLCCSRHFMLCPTMTTKKAKPDIDLTGQEVGYWRVLAYAFNGKWACRCICGVERPVKTQALVEKTSKSCGCRREEFVSAAFTKRHGLRARYSIFNNYRGAARRREYEWGLSFEQFCGFLEKPCFYCGIEPSSLWNDSYMDRAGKHFGKRQDFYYNGVDRLDNSAGYAEGNCVTACWRCNFSKNDLSREEWLTWVKRLYEHQELDKGVLVCLSNITTS